jgi:hypothetical protein
MDGWRTGDPRVRRGLLGAFFDELDILDGQVVAVVPRAEYAAEVATLLEQVGAVTRSSPGGIRGDVQSTPPLVPALRFAEIRDALRLPWMRSPQRPRDVPGQGSVSGSWRRVATPTADQMR